MEISAIKRVPLKNALLYFPTPEDIKSITRDTENLPFWETVLNQDFSLKEDQVRQKPAAARFNIEYAVLSGT